MRTIENQNLHDRLVKARVKEYETQGFVVFADHIGQQRPDEILGHIPDIVGIGTTLRVVAEVETSDSLLLPETEKQLVAFSKASADELHLIVPETGIENARNLVKRLGIKALIFYYQGC